MAGDGYELQLFAPFYVEVRTLVLYTTRIRV
jgi:hypothetical protein